LKSAYLIGPWLEGLGNGGVDMEEGRREVEDGRRESNG
jgi:hypothetical protein